MKKLFNKRKKLIQEAKEVGRLLDNAIQERWGFHFSETDDYEIIDTLDYGTNDISFRQFVDKMDDYKKEKKYGRLD